jgi:hypothetical protein
MARSRFTRHLAGTRLLVSAMLGLAVSLPMPVAAVDASSPLERLAGRWAGDGRLGVKGNPTEHVKCRVTYVYVHAGDQLKQNIRCASAGGNVEVHSVVSHLSGKLTGSWQEVVRNLSGDLTGTVTPRGFKVNVRGDSLTANMDIILVNSKQVIEIQFINSSLLGLTLVLERG